MLYESYCSFLRLSYAMSRMDKTAYSSYEDLAKSVIDLLENGQCALLYERLTLSPALLYDGSNAIKNTEEYISKMSGEALERLSFSGDHPAWVIQALCNDARKHFGLSENDKPDVDESLLRDFVRSAFPKRFDSGSRLAPMDLESIISVLPTEYVMANTQLSNELASSRVESGEMDMVVKSPRRGSSKPALTKAILTFGDDKAVITAARQKYTPYDSAVYSGVITLYEAENNVITPAMVYRAMNGLTDSEYVNPSTLAKVSKSIEKNRKSQLSIDFTEEAQQYMRSYEEPGKDFKTTYEGDLLVADKITVKNNGVEQTAYKILRKPILYEYAQTVGQVISVPIRLLQTKGGVRSTEDVIVLREFLLRQIENYRRRHRSGSLSIAYKEIYGVCGITEDSHKNLKDKHKKIRNHTEALLSEWLRLDYIKSFESKRDGTRAIALVEICI